MCQIALGLTERDYLYEEQQKGFGYWEFGSKNGVYSSSNCGKTKRNKEISIENVWLYLDLSFILHHKGAVNGKKDEQIITFSEIKVSSTSSFI